MTSRSDLPDLTPRERAQYGEARAKNIAFDAVIKLWRRRRAEGMKQIDIANAIGRQPATVSRNLRGPRNFTLRTLGEFVEALNGELEIIVRPVEETRAKLSNYNAYLVASGDITQTSPSTRQPTVEQEGASIRTILSS